jgi:hypothetical protein
MTHSHLYLLRSIEHPDLYKIGVTNNPTQRFHQLKVGKRTKVLNVGDVGDADKLERLLHKQYDNKRLPQSEWFKLTEEDVKFVYDCCVGTTQPKVVTTTTTVVKQVTYDRYFTPKEMKEYRESLGPKVLSPEEDKAARNIIKGIVIAFAILIGCTLYGEHLDYVKDQQRLQQSTIQQAR